MQLQPHRGLGWAALLIFMVLSHSNFGWPTMDLHGPPWTSYNYGELFPRCAAS